MGALQIILGILGFFFVLGIAVWYAYHNRLAKNVEVPINSPRIYLFSKREFTDGYWEGTLISERPNRNGTTYFKFAPGDVQQGEEVKMANNQKFVALNSNIIRFSQGELSTRRQVIIITGRNASEFPRRMQNTLEYDFLTKEGQMAFIKETFGTMIQSGDEAIGEAMLEYARGNPTAHALSEIKERIKKENELKNLQNKEDKKE